MCRDLTLSDININALPSPLEGAVLTCWYDDIFFLHNGHASPSHAEMHL